MDEVILREGTNGLYPEGGKAKESFKERA